MVVISSAFALQWFANGYGRHADQLTQNEILKGLKDRYVFLMISPVSVTMPKYSALWFYVRVFGTNARYFRVSLLATGALVTACMMFGLMTSILECVPFRKAWLPTVPGHCLDNYTMIFIFSLLSVVVDVLIMLLPLPVLWRLHAGRSQRLSLISLFFCGYW